MKVLWESKFYDVDIISETIEYHGFDICDNKNREVGVIIEQLVVRHQGRPFPAARVRMARNGHEFGAAGSFHMFIGNADMNSHCRVKKQAAYRRWMRKGVEPKLINPLNPNDDFDFRENQKYLDRIGVA